MDKCLSIERSIITTYRSRIWKPFVSAIIEYELINDDDKIAVCMSGGKDSMLLAKCMQELKAHGKNNFELFFLVMDPGYSDINKQKIIDNAKLLNVPIQIFNSNIFNIVADIKDSPCYLCARMRRGCLYNKAKEMGCNKIALGHHFDDVIETILMSALYNGQIKTMMPKLHSLNFEGMELIRPLYQVKEADIVNWKNLNGLDFIKCACRFTENCSINQDIAGKRTEIKSLITRLRKINPIFDHNIFKSMYNINLGAVIGHKLNGKIYNFLNNYDNDSADTEE
ncbi:MAG: ATP-binding protein [Clostridia bacterium]|nr:ATP-binding protein [Clostridia bacterium]